jgi:hypothetical protein
MTSGRGGVLVGTALLVATGCRAGGSRGDPRDRASALPARESTASVAPRVAAPKRPEARPRHPVVTFLERVCLARDRLYLGAHVQLPLPVRSCGGEVNRHCRSFRTNALEVVEAEVCAANVVAFGDNLKLLEDPSAEDQVPGIVEKEKGWVFSDLTGQFGIRSTFRRGADGAAVLLEVEGE